MERNHDVRAGGQGGELQNSVIEWFSEDDRAGGMATTPPESCASCGDGGSIQWLKMTVDWEDALCRRRGVERPEGVCLLPLCSRCRAWAEIIEIAEMAAPELSRAEHRRILGERDRFLETLSVELVRGLRVSEELSSYSEDR